MRYAGSQQNIHEVISGSDNMDLDGRSAISEAFHADQVEESEIVDQRPPEYILASFFYYI